MNAKRPHWALAFTALLLGSTGEVTAEEARPSDARSPEATSVASDATGRRRDSLGMLAQETERLVAALSRAGTVTRLPPRFLERGDQLPLLLHRSPTPNKPSSSCSTWIALGSNNLSFSLHPSPEYEAHPRLAWPVPSAAGLAWLTRCGAQKSQLDQLTLHFRSARGLVELLLLESAEPPPSLTELLPTRHSGPSPVNPQLGARPAGAPIAHRLPLLDAENRQRGAHSQKTHEVPLDSRGQGQLVLTVEPGCYQLDVLAEPGDETPPDLDAVLSRLQDQEELTRDVSESPRPRLRFCVGRAERLLLKLEGGVPLTPVQVLEARWLLPRGIPVSWGPRARAEMAQTLWRELPARMQNSPLLSSLGIQGSTDLWLQPRSGACYLVGVTALRGQLARMILSQETSQGTRTVRSLPERGGTSLSFCPTDPERVRLRVQSYGSGLAWILGVWEFPEADAP